MPRRRHSKKSKAKDEPHTDQPKGLEIPDVEVITDIARQYYEKYGERIGKPAGSSGSGSSTGSNWSYTPPKPRKTCKHWQVPITLAEGIVIHASAHRDHPTGKDTWFYPDVGAYFASSWDTFSSKASSFNRNVFTEKWAGPVPPPKKEEKKEIPAELAVIDWPDMGIPADTTYAIEVLEYLLNKAGNKQFVEIGCIGGHGRTGTAIAGMLILLGEDDASKAMEWVWNNYCEHAIESTRQEDWLWELAIKTHPSTALAKKEAYDLAVSKARAEADAKKKAEDAKKKKDGGTPLSKGLSIVKNHFTPTGSTVTSDNKTQAETIELLKDAAEEYEMLMEGSMSHENAIRFLSYTYAFLEEEILEAIKKYGGDKKRDVTEEILSQIDEQLNEYGSFDEYAIINEASARDSLPGRTECGLCGKTYETCTCLDRYSI